MLSAGEWSVAMPKVLKIVSWKAWNAWTNCWMRRLLSRLALMSAVMRSL